MCVKITPREKGETRWGERKISMEFLSPSCRRSSSRNVFSGKEQRETAVFQATTSETLERMGTSFGCSDFCNRLGGQVLVLIGR